MKCAPPSILLFAVVIHLYVAMITTSAPMMGVLMNNACTLIFAEVPALTESKTEQKRVLTVEESVLLVQPAMMEFRMAMRPALIAEESVPGPMYVAFAPMTPSMVNIMVRDRITAGFVIMIPIMEVITGNGWMAVAFASMRRVTEVVVEEPVHLVPLAPMEAKTEQKRVLTAEEVVRLVLLAPMMLSAGILIFVQQIVVLVVFVLTRR